VMRICVSLACRPASSAPGVADQGRGTGRSDLDLLHRVVGGQRVQVGHAGAGDGHAQRGGEAVGHRRGRRPLRARSAATRSLSLCVMSLELGAQRAQRRSRPWPGGRRCRTPAATARRCWRPAWRRLAALTSLTARPGSRPRSWPACQRYCSKAAAVKRQRGAGGVGLLDAGSAWGHRRPGRPGCAAMPAASPLTFMPRDPAVGRPAGRRHVGHVHLVQRQRVAAALHQCRAPACAASSWSACSATLVAPVVQHDAAELAASQPGRPGRAMALGHRCCRRRSGRSSRRRCRPPAAAACATVAPVHAELLRRRRSGPSARRPGGQVLGGRERQRAPRRSCSPWLSVAADGSAARSSWPPGCGRCRPR
jgi:hypothetical protein